MKPVDTIKSLKRENTYLRRVIDSYQDETKKLLIRIAKQNESLPRIWDKGEQKPARNMNKRNL